MGHSYLDVIQTYWDDILQLYKQFEDQRPVMLFDLEKKEIFAYPYEGFKAKLSRKSRQPFEQQYQRAVENNYMVVFVKDNKNNHIASYSLEIDEMLDE